jgi:signal transduction histidine kinase
MTAAQATPIPSSPGSRIAAFFTSPIAGKLEGSDSRNSRLLAWITLIIVIGLLINLMFSVVLTVVIAAMVTFAAHLLSRTRYYKIAGLMVVAALTLPSFASIANGSTDEFSRDWMAARSIWLALPLVLASTFLSRREVAIVGGSIFGALTLMPVIIEGMEFSLTPGILGFFSILLLLTLVAMGHRDRIEADRQRELTTAVTRLSESEALLERRVEERTAELRIAKEQADEARQRAEQSDQVKSQFLASMSHELRTPLNAILNFVDMTIMGIFGPINAEQTDAMQKSLDSGKHLLSLINDVLDITKIHSGMMKLFLEDDVNLSEEVKGVAATVEPMIAGKSLTFNLDVDENLPVIRADRRRIRQVLLNLVSNAARFTERGSITMRASQKDGKVVFAVVDTGPGIAEEDQTIIFEPFQQTETGIRHAGGTGLGLPISRYLVEAHGGKVWVESQRGQGATFFVEIPLAASTES